MWNTLDPPIRSARSLGIFKSRLKYFYENNKSKLYYYLGSRKHTSLMASIRIESSQLNVHLYTNGLSENKFCTCGSVETTYHYFMECSDYIRERDELFTNTLNIGFINFEIIMYGYDDKETIRNNTLCNSICKYTEKTGRF